MTDRVRQRVLVLGVLVLSLVATLFGRLWYVQVLSGPTYRAAAVANQQRTLSTPAPRGAILDDEGRALADDAYEYVVTINQDTLAAQKDGGAAVLARLSPILGESVTDLKNKIRLCGQPDPKTGKKVGQPCYTGSPYAPIPVKDYAPNDTAGLQKALGIEERSELFPGVKVAEQQVRQYPYGSLAGHELGYLLPINAQQLTEPQYAGYQPTDLVGQSGLEQQYDKQLRGTDSVQKVSVDAAGRVTGTISQTQPVPGDTLVTNIDAGLQQAVDKELQNGIKLAQRQGKYGTTAAAVVLDAQNGAVLAMSSLPNYDPNEFTGGISTANYAKLSDPHASNPLISRAFSAAYPPGSTFKISSASTILHYGLATPTTPVDCGGAFKVGNEAFHNFEGEALGYIDLYTAIEKSCDTYFYSFAYNQWLADGGLRLTPATRAKPDRQVFVTMAKAYGYGKDTGLDLPNESAGVLFDRQEKAQVVKAEQKQACIGATTHPDDPAREAADKKMCDTPTDQLTALQAGDAVDFAIGQGGQVNVTVLQQAVAYAALANGGTLYAPQVAKAFIAPDGTVTKVQPKVTGHLPISPANRAALMKGFTEVVQSSGGTGSGAGFPPQLDVAGKTGTADVAATGILANQAESWFVSMQPASNPKYVIAVMIEHGGQGALSAAIVNANIYKDMYGLDGHPAVWPNGQPPATLPSISPIGTVTPPQAGIIGVTPQPPLPGGTPDPIAVENAIAEQAAQAAAAAAKKGGG
ncbi:MAG TPA: penicillin-binding protein 2 [Mycobacteriales bacterium]